MFPFPVAGFLETQFVREMEQHKDIADHELITLSFNQQITVPQSPAVQTKY